MANVDKLLKLVEEKGRKLKEAEDQFDKLEKTALKLTDNIVDDEVVEVDEIEMPEDFIKGIKEGGKVKTKNLDGDRFMRICYLGGKSFASEIRTKEEADEELEVLKEMGARIDPDPIEDESIRGQITEKLDLSFTNKIVEKSVDDRSRTVIAGILQEDTLSSNNRFYPAHVVQEAVSGLAGRRSLIGHESNSVEDVVARITEAGISNRIAYATFKFGTDEKSEMIFSKIKEGLIDSTSIRANGETRRAKVDGNFVDVVESLDIYSVDWVVEGGIKNAKVVQVFETAQFISFEKHENEEEIDAMEKKELEKAVEEANAKIEELQKASLEKDQSVDEMKQTILERDLDIHRKELLATVVDVEDREMIKDQLIGKTNEEIDTAFKAQVKYYEGLKKKAGLEEDDVVIKATDDKDGEKKDLKFRSVNELLESSDVPQDKKLEVIKKLLG